MEDYSTWTKHTVANAREVDRLRAELERVRGEWATTRSDDVQVIHELRAELDRHRAWEQRLTVAGDALAATLEEVAHRETDAEAQWRSVRGDDAPKSTDE